MRQSVKKVLVYDTQNGEKNRLAWQLPHDRYAVTVAHDMPEAMELARDSSYDVALIEVDLPKRNSIDLLRLIHHDRPATKVIMMTDYGDEELWVDVMNEGASDLITRPVAGFELEKSF